MQSSILQILFNGTDGIDVEPFLFAYENVIIRVRSGEDNAAWRFAFLSEEARASYHARFIGGWFLSKQIRDYLYLFDCLIDCYHQITDPKQLIRISMNAKLHK